MKRTFAVVVVAVLVAGVAMGETLAPADRDFGLKHLEKTRQGVLKQTEGLSAAQWNYKPAPERWSVAEVVEHLAASEDFLRQRVDEVMKGEAMTEDRPDAKEVDEMILTRITDRSQPAQAPEPLRPTGRFGSPEKSLEHFLDSRAVTLNAMKTTEGLRAHAVDFPPWGKKLDAYQWLLFISAHTERHTKQIEEVKADPNFPKQ